MSILEKSYQNKALNTESETPSHFRQESLDSNLVRQACRRRSLNENLPPLQPYYYDFDGNMCVNPLPYKLTSTTRTSEPLKYRSDSVRLKRHSETPKANNTIKKFKPNLMKLTEIKQLEDTMWYREIYVIKDGTKIENSQEVFGFKYKINCDSYVNRFQKALELDAFFNYCQKYFKSNQKFKFLFSADGKLLQNLAEIPPHAKLVFVGASPVFSGLVEEYITTEFSVETSSMPRITIEDFERTFTSMGSRSSKRRTNMSLDFSEQAANKKVTLFKLRNKAVAKKPLEIQKHRIAKKFDKTDYLTQLKKRLAEVTVKIDKTIPKLREQNIEEITEKYEFSESDLHKVYAQYKTFLLLSVAQDPYHDINKGIKKDTFIEILKHKSQQDIKLVEQIFKSVDSNANGFIDWEEYLKAMSVMSFGNLSQQIDMMFSIQGTSGMLSFKDIKQLCNTKLQFASQDEISDYLSESFAKIIYDLAKVDTNQSISSEQLKNILGQRKEIGLMRMFCSFDFLNI
ncbi:unnamed protein product [Blepharisma stoltei]|uniref:EF-hand domain-containing protein n=1 Tax=Blepharisma stoltei TaxID=1481888 RepID=A0AAU9KMZ4_9CILI|nr:unnamed protein product [Blepharisma stoltei]